MNKRFKIKSVVVTEPYRLSVTFGDDVTMDIDLSTIMAQNNFLSQLCDATLFCKARVSEYGQEVVWNDDISIAGDNLRAEGVEQAGGVSHERIWEWMYRNSLTLDTASEALGISRRMLAYYRNGEKPIPKHIWLACLGWEHNRDVHKGLMKQAA
jgi:Protein of unknown function (DUF2442)